MEDRRQTLILGKTGPLAQMFSKLDIIVDLNHTDNDDDSDSDYDCGDDNDDYD